MSPQYEARNFDLGKLRTPKGRAEFLQEVREMYSGEAKGLDLRAEAHSISNTADSALLEGLKQAQKTKDRQRHNQHQIVQHRAGELLTKLDHFLSRHPGLLPKIIAELANKHGFNMFVLYDLGVSYSASSGLVNWDTGLNILKQDLASGFNAFKTFTESTLAPFLLHWSVHGFDIDVLEPPLLTGAQLYDRHTRLIEANFLPYIYPKSSSSFRSVAIEFRDDRSVRCVCYDFENPDSPSWGDKQYDWIHSIGG